MFIGFSMLICIATMLLMCFKPQIEGCSFSNLQQDDIEAITACESIGWWDNNGNCVKNSKTKKYFCKDDTWYEITDCLK